jgi:hypothetical protein
MQSCKFIGVGGTMRKALLSTCVFAGCILSASVPLASQEIIHAFTGTVSAINEAAKTITVFRDNGSEGVFHEMENSKTRIAFDKKVADATTAVAKFDKSGAYAIVFYFGDRDNPTVVALKNLGAGPFESTTGTVAKVEAHNRSITVADETGALHTFKIDKDTVAEGPMGAVGGERFDVNKGDRVRVVSGTVGGETMILFVRDL